jgi:hypothetical protein
MYCGLLSHFLLQPGYPVFSALLPSVGFSSPSSTAEKHVGYIRTKMLLPLLDHEDRDVVMLMHI